MTKIPEISLRNVKHYPSMSEETDCFEATVYVDGVLAGRVSNRGCGGAHDYGFDTRPIDQRFKEAGEQVTLGSGDEAITVVMDLELAIGDALSRYLTLKEVKRKVLALNPQDGKVYEFPKRRGQTKDEVEASVRRTKPGFRLLVDMPESEQIKLLQAS